MAHPSAWLFVGVDRLQEEGRALAPGLALKPSGGVAMVEGDGAVRQAIMMLLSTIPGERVMRPDYGCPLHRLIFEPNDATTAGLGIHYVRQSLKRWEPRVDIVRLDAGADAGADASENFLLIHLTYRVRASRRVDELSLAVDLGGGRA